MKSNVTLFFSSFFQSSFPDGKLTPSHLYLFIKDLIVVIFPGFFLHELTESNRLLKAFIMLFILLWNLLLLFGFLSNQENLYMIPHDSDLFYGIYSTLNEHNSLTTIQ